MTTIVATRASFPAVSESSRLRLWIIFLLYIAQGLPLGLFYLAIPAWMATNGATALEVGAFLSATSLPWTLKFANGFIMERFTYLPMGRRRAWLIGSQMLIVAGLVAIAVFDPGPRDIALLSALSFGINIATTFQDVAVDGMAVDLVPVAERPRANSLMFGGQALGMAGAGAAAGAGIGVFGLAGVVAIAALAVTLLVVLLLVCRERPGERLLPWTAGCASAECEAVQMRAWAPIFREIGRAMTRGPSLLLLPALLMGGAGSGLYSGIAPLIGAKVAGWSAPQVSGLMATGSLIAGGLAVLAFGWLIGRVGERRTAMFAFAGVLGLGIAVVALQPWWTQGWPLSLLILPTDALCFLITICLSTIAMRHCAPAVAATQFGLYMATANLGRTLSSALIGPLDALGGNPALLFGFAATGLLGVAILARNRD
ncbi:MFS transporter [Phenylobacterium sp.]|uniref:MFS transporter n=1 Tax=Phenylobacterium sp. TaxID=1871053 RepID=UPI0039835131